MLMDMIILRGAMTRQPPGSFGRAAREDVPPTVSGGISRWWSGLRALIAR